MNFLNILTGFVGAILAGIHFVVMVMLLVSILVVGGLVLIRIAFPDFYREWVAPILSAVLEVAVKSIRR